MPANRGVAVVRNAPATEFDPQKYLTRVSGGDYLEVKWRLVWMREQHPDAEIETELVSHVDNTAVFKATITLYREVTGADSKLIGRKAAGRATGYGSESSGDFRDYLEKAETKAIGRALAALGFGTQFTGFDFKTTDTPDPDTTQPPGQPLEAATRVDLLARVAQLQERVGSQKLIDWCTANTKGEDGSPKSKKTDLTDEELRRLLNDLGGS